MGKNTYQSVNPYIIDALMANSKKSYKKKSESIDLVSNCTSSHRIYLE